MKDKKKNRRHPVHFLMKLKIPSMKDIKVFYRPQKTIKNLK